MESAVPVFFPTTEAMLFPFDTKEQLVLTQSISTLNLWHNNIYQTQHRLAFTGKSEEWHWNNSHPAILAL